MQFCPAGIEDQEIEVERLLERCLWDWNSALAAGRKCEQRMRQQLGQRLSSCLEFHDSLVCNSFSRLFLLKKKYSAWLERPFTWMPQSGCASVIRHAGSLPRATATRAPGHDLSSPIPEHVFKTCVTIPTVSQPTDQAPNALDLQFCSLFGSRMKGQRWPS